MRTFKRRFMIATGRAANAAAELNWVPVEGPALANLFERMLLPSIRSQIKLMSTGLPQPTLDQLAMFAGRAEEAASINQSGGTLSPAWKKQRLELIALKEEVLGIALQQGASSTQPAVVAALTTVAESAEITQRTRRSCFQFQTGACSYGDRCRFEHEGAEQPTRGGGPRGKMRGDQSKTSFCTECSQQGHTWYDCTIVCRGCGQEHDFRGCPVITKQYGCHQCGQPGHLRRMCPGPDRQPQAGAPARVQNPGREPALSAAQSANYHLSLLRKLSEKLDSLTRE